MQAEQMTKKRPFSLVRVVARGGVEPPTFRFSVPSPPDRSTTTWHFACCNYVAEVADASRALKLLDSLLDSQQLVDRGGQLIASRTQAPGSYTRVGIEATPSSHGHSSSG